MATSYKHKPPLTHPSAAELEDSESSSDQGWIIPRHSDSISRREARTSGSDEDWHVLSPHPTISAESTGSSIGAHGIGIETESEVEKEGEGLWSSLPVHDGTGRFVAKSEPSVDEGDTNVGELSLEMLQKEMKLENANVERNEGESSDRTGLLERLRMTLSMFWRGLYLGEFMENSEMLSHADRRSSMEDILRLHRRAITTSAFPPSFDAYTSASPFSQYASSRGGRFISEQRWRQLLKDPRNLPIILLRTVCEALGSVGEYLIEQDMIVAEILAQIGEERGVVESNDGLDEEEDWWRPPSQQPLRRTRSECAMERRRRRLQLEGEEWGKSSEEITA
ncbi:uncharacterized protein VTP21DRAFT_7613 [Calcarisporiella thermophila]|uniref:uncharacterized protein n=1 Tax=Calcarisporiella thermophila TaxID=911321 RepID=UPI00374480F1